MSRLDDVKPVAYLNKYLDKSTNITRYKPENQRLLSSNPLYTVEQLHPRVKMTKKQYDRLMFDKENTDLSTCFGYFLEHDGVNNFCLPSENLMGLLKQEDIARAWLNPEKTIEIVPDMKWFVRSKERNLEKNYYYFVGKRPADNWPRYGYKMAAKQFDTKEEAEKWKNPLTEVVLLPIEGDD